MERHGRMISIADTIEPDRVRLTLSSDISSIAIDEVAATLRNVSEVLDWDELHASLHRSSPCLAEMGGEFAICFPHARTDAVTNMVMGVGRSLKGVKFPGCVSPVRYIFCIGVPKALANDYLRIMGLLARVLKQPRTEQALRNAQTPIEFIHHLSVLEATL
jgi:mannitol/fructose-specific phosphotransferase system IIA component (Ntr-type)